MTYLHNIKCVILVLSPKSFESNIEMEIIDDGDFEEEETLLYVEVDPSSMTERQLRKGTKNLKLFGLDAKEPLMQISNRFFQGKQQVSCEDTESKINSFIGEFESSMGTHVFLEKVERKAVDELYSKCESYYNFTAATKKVLKASRVLLKDKALDSLIQPEKDVKDMKNQLRVQINYEEALNMLLAEGRQQPVRIHNLFEMPLLIEDIRTEGIAKDLRGELLLTPEVAAIGKPISEDKRETAVEK